MKSFVFVYALSIFLSHAAFADSIYCRGKLSLVPRISGNEVLYTLSENSRGQTGSYRILWDVSEDHRIVISGKDDRDNFLSLRSSPGAALLGFGEEFSAKLWKVSRSNKKISVTCRIIETGLN